MQDSPEMREFITSLFIEQSQREKAQKLERFRRLNRFVRKGQIVFAGSSLMEQFPINELLMDAGLPLTIYNRGVGGFTTAEFAKALNPCVIDLSPKHVFINIGTNDLNGPDYTLSGLIGRYEMILQTLQNHLPQTKLYLLAYYPVNEMIGARDPFVGQIFQFRTNERIQEANEALQQLACRTGADYLDLNSGILDDEGRMKAEYTIEGMHMYGDGYMEVFKSLLPILQSIS